MVNQRPEPASPIGSVKRKKLEEDTLTGTSAKKPRTRVSFSCGECHRRKQKCDRQTPCSHCVARKVPHLCQAYTPGKTEHDIGARLARLEHIIELALPQFCALDLHSLPESHTIPRAKSSTPAEDDQVQFDDQDPSGGAFQGGKWYGNSASGSIAPASVLEQLQHATMPQSGVESTAKERLTIPDTSFNGSISNATKNSTVLDSATLEPAGTDYLKTLVQECGVSLHNLSDFLQELPQIQLSDLLIDYYFKSINWTRYPLSESNFRLSYASIRKNSVNGVGSMSHSDIRFLPLLFVVLAIAMRLAPEDIGGDAHIRRITSLRYYWSSRRALLVTAAIQPDSVDMVFTRLLSARFLTFDRRITECWSQLGAAVRTAQALGLHRDGSTMNMAHKDVEYRRRIWSYLYHADRSYALVLGRPNAIQDDYTSTREPSNIDDESPNPVSLPLSTPTAMTFLVLRHRLAEIIGRIVHHFQKVGSASHYSEVNILDDDLLRFIKELPPHFSLTPDQSLDDKLHFLPVHRFFLITEILFVRTSLHRPYILKKSVANRYARSRMACFESAIKDYEVRKAFRQTVPRQARDALSNAYREFQTAMIAGIYLALYPSGQDAVIMHDILVDFLQDHEGMRDIDDTTRREMNVIQFLKSKASEMQTTSNVAVNGSGGEAQLLLSLQKPTSLRTSAFPSLTDLSALNGGPASPTLLYTGTPINNSPTFKRLQHTSPGDFATSPTGSSPGTDDDSPAQSLLDHWCNTVNNAAVDDIALTWGGHGGADFSGWVGAAPNTGLADPTLLSRPDGLEWNYWEALVSQIQRADSL